MKDDAVKKVVFAGVFAALTFVVAALSKYASKLFFLRCALYFVH